MQTNTSSPTLAPVPTQVAPVAPIAPIAPSKPKHTKTYFIPMLFYRHSTIVLCDHRHLNKVNAEKCLVKIKQQLKEALESPNLSRKARRQYQESIKLFVREVQLKKVYCLAGEIDHHQDRIVKQRNMLDMLDDYSPFYLHSLSDMSLPEIKAVIDTYHDEPKRSKRVVKHLTDVFPLHIPKCCQNKKKAQAVSSTLPSRMVVIVSA